MSVNPAPKENLDLDLICLDISEGSVEVAASGSRGDSLSSPQGHHDHDPYVPGRRERAGSRGDTEPARGHTPYVTDHRGGVDVRCHAPEPQPCYRDAYLDACHIIKHLKLLLSASERQYDRETRELYAQRERCAELEIRLERATASLTELKERASLSFSFGSPVEDNGPVFKRTKGLL